MRSSLLIGALVFVLVFAATATGVFYRTQEPRIEHTTVRGEPAIFHGSGLYRYDPAPLALEAIIWDVINLSVGLPLLAVGILLAARGSLRGRLLLAGLLSYFFYVYLMYATMMAFNRMFLVYVAIFALCAVAFPLNLLGVDISSLPDRVSARFPRRIFAVYMIVLAAMLTALWLRLVVPMTITNVLPPELSGMSTLESQALDLGLIVPLSLVAGILLLRRSRWGYLLAGVGITHGFMMFLAIPTWIVVPLIQNGSLSPVEASPFLLLCLVGLFLAVWFYRCVQGQAGPRATREP